MRLLFVTQQVDPDHPALGATVPKIAALARRVDEVVVLADGAVPDALPGNARVRTFGARTKAGRGARFEAALAAELRGLRGGAVVAHMCPIYAVLAAPLVRPLRIPLVLWFTHWRASRLLQAAERVATAVVSVDERSFPLPSSKLRAIGHGIDLSEFGCDERRDRPAHPESRRHLRLRGAPAPAAARPARARLGHPVPDAPRGRARRLGVRARARSTRGPPRRDQAQGGRRPDRVHGDRGPSRATAAADPPHPPCARGRVRATRRGVQSRAAPAVD